MNIYDDRDKIQNNIVNKETQQRELEEAISNMDQPCKKPENDSEYYKNNLELCVDKLEECRIISEKFDSNSLYITNERLSNFFTEHLENNKKSWRDNK